LQNLYKFLFSSARNNQCLSDWIENFFAIFFARIVFICNFAADSDSPKGWRVENLLEKGRLRTLSSDVESRKFTSQEDAQLKRPHWVYCTMLFICELRQYFSAWAIELLILGEAMREPYIGISEVEHPRLSV